MIRFSLTKYNDSKNEQEIQMAKQKLLFKSFSYHHDQHEQHDHNNGNVQKTDKRSQYIIVLYRLSSFSSSYVMA